SRTFRGDVVKNPSIGQGVLYLVIAGAGLAVFIPDFAGSQDRKQDPPTDAVTTAQTHKAVRAERPEQIKTDHDRSDIFDDRNAKPNTDAVKPQPKEGKISDFDFYRDPLNSDRPGTTPEEIAAKESAGKGKVMEGQRKFLETRYN